MHELIATLGRNTREIARARHLVKRALCAWGLDDHVAALQLLVSELVSNALQHGDGPIHLALTSDDALVRLEVVDAGGGSRPRLLHSEGPGGWGLHFVDQLAERWGTEDLGHGRLVWLVRRITQRDERGGEEPG